MSARGAAEVWLGVAAVLLAAGCAVKRVENGVYHSPKGYRIAVPGPEWAPVEESPADLELRHRASPAAMAVNAVCGGSRRRPEDVLARHLVIGLRDRVLLERDAVSVAGRPGRRVVLDGRLENGTATVRIEAVTMTDERCVYDLLYAAPPEAFAVARDDFARFVESFRPSGPVGE